jgi:hypothetical protein
MRRSGNFFRLAVAVLLLLAGGACGHAATKSGTTRADQALGKPVSEYHLHRFIPYTLRVRRPPGPGANPKAGPGGIDYRSDPVPDANFDCKEVAWLFKDLKLEDLRACIAHAKGGRAVYLVRRLPVPYLELQEEDDMPACLKAVLATIPLPREIFFQSVEGDRLACYSTRLAIEANEVVGFKMPIDKAEVRLDFPMATQPKDDDEMRMLLMSWALTPFWDHSNSTLTAHLVPDKICATCLGERTMLKPGDPEPVSWPE